MHASQNNTDIYFLKPKLSDSWERIESALSQEYFSMDIEEFKGKCRNERKRCKSCQKEKFDCLGNETKRISTRSNSESKKRWVVNLSSKPLTSAEKSILERGLNFAPAPKNVPVPQMVAGVEQGLMKLGNLDLARDIRTRIVGVLMKAQPPTNNISRNESKAIKELKHDKDIIILKADKGGATVVMDEEYDFLNGWYAGGYMYIQEVEQRPYTSSTKEN